MISRRASVVAAAMKPHHHRRFVRARRRSDIQHQAIFAQLQGAQLPPADVAGRRILDALLILIVKLKPGTRAAL
jgi:hypothetical protein